MSEAITSLTTIQTEVLDELAVANQHFSDQFPGERPERQPVHTVYGGAHLFKAETCRKLGQIALRHLRQYAPDAFVFAQALGLAGASDLPTAASAQQQLLAQFERDTSQLRSTNPSAYFALTVYNRVATKLSKQAVEDFRIDFEDGYGNRSDTEEDNAATQTALETARAMQEELLPPFIGIRIKPFTEEHKHRATRTLDIFVSTLARNTGGQLPRNFVVTLPKVTIPEQVTALVQLFSGLENELSLPPDSLHLELMIETTQSLLTSNGRINLPLLLRASQGRCTGAHFGTYDYTASCNVTAAHQTLDHPICDHAKNMMTLAYAGTGLFVSDGATNVMPIAPHRAAKGETLTQDQLTENQSVVHGAWRLAFDHVRHSLRNGYYQGWDLHPGQLPVRYAACYSFFLEGLQQAAQRLRNFVDQAAQATLVGDVFDDAATGQGLLNYFLRALNCGAISEAELAATGLSLEQIRLRSFAKILAQLPNK